LADDYPDLPQYQRELAATLREIGAEQFVIEEDTRAFENLRESRRRLEALVKAVPKEREYAIQLALTLRELSRMQLETQALQPAWESVQESRRILLEQLEKSPDKESLSALLAECEALLAKIEAAKNPSPEPPEKATP
jgi:hypothetical protein